MIVTSIVIGILLFIALMAAIIVGCVEYQIAVENYGSQMVWFSYFYLIKKIFFRKQRTKLIENHLFHTYHFRSISLCFLFYFLCNN
jgi:hypothetical protein